jgi:hypothetical protein
MSPSAGEWCLTDAVTRSPFASSLQTAFCSSLLLLAPACRQAPLPVPPPPPQALIASESDVTGCYALDTLEWTPHVPSLQGCLFAPPRFFSLIASGAVSSNPTRRRIRPRDEYPVHAQSWWHILDQRAIEATWTTGYAGVRVTVQRGAARDSWEGHAEPFSDDGAPAWSGRVVLRRISVASCERNR